MSRLNREEQSLDYRRGYDQGYKEGLNKGLEELVKREQLKTDVKVMVTKDKPDLTREEAAALLCEHNTLFCNSCPMSRLKLCTLLRHDNKISAFAKLRSYISSEGDGQ